MILPAFLRKYWKNDLGVLILLAFAWLLILTAASVVSANQYGFHRDELAFIDNARHLDWGFIEYPPFSPLLARLALDIFGPSVVGLRFLASLAVCGSMVLAGLIARLLGGKRWAQIITAISVASAPIVVFNAFFFSYQTFDYLFWVLTAYFILKVLKTDNPRWWLAVGAAVGLGMMNKYTMAFLAVGILVGVVFTPARRYLRSPWLYAGAALALVIFLPNLVWQAQHNFISLSYQGATQARNIQLGRTSTYLVGQLYVCINIATILICLNGLRYYALSPQGKPLRLAAWLYAVPFLLFLVAQGRDYYMAGAYPLLLAGGAVWMEQRQEEMSAERRAASRKGQHVGLAVSILIILLIGLPVFPINSGLWNVAVSINSEVREEIGWPELARTVKGIYAALPPDQQAQAGILTANYGEAGAIDVYGPALGLPQVISGINSYWLRGYRNPPPQILIVLGMRQAYTSRFFETCQLAGHPSNPYGVLNEETQYHPDIFVCRNLRTSWPEFWKSIESFG